MTRESVILNSCGGLECRSECLTTIYTEGPEFNPYQGKGEGEEGRERRGGEKVNELSTTTKQQTTTDPQYYMQ